MIPRSRVRRQARAQIFTASMADVVFLLIVFFVLTYRPTLDPTQVELPDTRIQTVIPDDAALISIAPPAADEVIRVSNGRAPAVPVGSLEELVSFAATLVRDDVARPFVIRADRTVSYRRIDQVIQALRDARARDVLLLSEEAAVVGE